ncbi:MAG: hypothetical protein BWY93_00825 [Euryarchaeota archaeon ADurb.BinA087]|nr:MAG: hypothetical protein BWY93_00825 [Euryarchaeota archaeon ADurb.BinA087]HPX73489.1 hypothetical protein [Methanoregulaceae archaeon]HQA81356.1 hypothetical protein [Methanoregulaceae archaeon]
MRAKKKILVFFLVFFLIFCTLIPCSIADFLVNETAETPVETTVQPSGDGYSLPGNNQVIQPAGTMNFTGQPTTKSATLQTTKPTTLPTTALTPKPTTLPTTDRTDKPTTEPTTRPTARPTTEPETVPFPDTVAPARAPVDPNSAPLQDLYFSSLTSKWMILTLMGILVLAGIAFYYYRKE